MKQTRLKTAVREQADVSLRFVWVGAASIVATIAFLAALILWIFPHSRADQRLSLPLPDYPQPRIQENPIEDLAAFLKEQKARLNSFGWIDQTAGIAHIPIDEAMQQIAREKISDWPGEPPKTAAPAGPSEKPLAQESDHETIRKAPSPVAPAAHRKLRRGGAAGGSPPKVGRSHPPRRGVP